MHVFNTIKQHIENLEGLKKLSSEELESIRNLHPEIQNSYLDFLGSIGFGNLGFLVLYDSPIRPNLIYPTERAGKLSHLILFGDDMQGFCYGFDSTHNYRVVEVDPRGNVDTSISPDFYEFLNSFIT